MRLGILLVSAAPAAALLAATASSSAAQRKNDSVGRAATEPLRDARIVKDKIPEALLLAQSAPYSGADTRNCAAIGRAVERLNAALGDDADVEGKPRGEGAYIAAAATRAAINTFIPGLGLVKVLTGADKAQRRAEAAAYAGAVRRAFLKGVGQARGCRPVAAPYPAAVAERPELPPEESEPAPR